jgi:glycerol uptake facilitator-like aquaporin
MFDEPLFSASTHGRSGVAQLLGELVAFAVGAYITAAYWFTSSTSFANPAVTLARAASNTFAGIRPIDAPAFIVAQVAGALSALVCFRALHAGNPPDSLRKEGSGTRDVA